MKPFEKAQQKAAEQLKALDTAKSRTEIATIQSCAVNTVAEAFNAEVPGASQADKKAMSAQYEHAIASITEAAASAREKVASEIEKKAEADADETAPGDAFALPKGRESRLG